MGNNQERYFLSRFLIGLYLTFGIRVVSGTTERSSSGTSFLLFQQFEYPRDCQEVLSSCSSTQNTTGVYKIRPDGYPEPFDVYCDNDIDSGGWTVLQRRQVMGPFMFSRDWKEFKNGFGFLGSEFWIGNERLAYLTNQKHYQLRLDVTNAAGETFYITYDQFRIVDEWGKYSLASLSNFKRTNGPNIEFCPINEVFSNQTCETTCSDPETCISSIGGVQEERCVCVGEYKMHGGTCIPQSQCGCFDTDQQSVITNGRSYVNDDCTRRSNCSNNRLTVEDNYRCSDDAICDVRNGVRRCYCNDEFHGNGVVCVRTVVHKDCHEIYLEGTRSDGVYTIYPDRYPSGIQVHCEMETNGGGWTLIQRRSSASVDFYRTWNEYKDGFEHPNRDHWLGNDYIHAITAQKTYTLRIDFTDNRGSSYYALYSSFSIGDDADKYRLSVGSYSGNAGHDGFNWINNMQFSTRDQDNDGSTFDCAEGHRGAWWYRGSSNTCSTCDGEAYCDFFPLGDVGRICTDVNLNGDYDGSTRGTSIFWGSGTGYDCGLQYADMKIRPA